MWFVLPSSSLCSDSFFLKVPQATPATRSPTPKITGVETQQQTSEGPAIPVLSSVHPETESSTALTTPKAPTVPLTEQRVSPSDTDVKPVVHPPQGTGIMQDSMQVDTPPQSAALGATVRKVSSGVPSPLKSSVENDVPQIESVAPVLVDTSQRQGPQSVRDIPPTDSSKPAPSSGTSLPIPDEETVPFGDARPASRSVSSVSAVALPVATDIVPFGGSSSIIPGLGPVVSASSFTPVIASAQPSLQPKPISHFQPAPGSTPSSVPSMRPPNVPVANGPPPAPVGIPAAEQATRPSLKERLDQPPVHQQMRPAGQPPSESQSFSQDRNANSNNMRGRNKKNQHPPYTGPPKAGDRSYNRPPMPSDGPPPPPVSAPVRAPFRGRSPPLDNRKMPVSPGPRGPPPRDYRGPPPGRSPSRERGGYARPPLPHDFVEPRRDSLDIDGPPPGRYDGRSSYPDYPPAPPLSGGRGPPPDVPPPGGRGEYYGSFAPSQDRNPRWEDPYYKRDWERGPPPGSADRGRFDRDYEPAGSWDRPDREFADRGMVKLSFFSVVLAHKHIA